MSTIIKKLTDKIKEKATPQGIAIAGMTAVGTTVLTPFITELIGDTTNAAGLTETDVDDAVSGASLKNIMIRLAVGCACRKSAAAVVNHAPKLMSEWGDEIMKHGGEMLSRLGEPLKDAAANALDVAKDALGLEDAAELAAEGAGAVADEFAASIAEEPLFTAVEAGADAAGEAVSETAEGFLSECLSKIGEMLLG